MQKRILLGFVETMDFIDEKNRSFSIKLLLILSLRDNGTDFFDAGQHG